MNIVPFQGGYAYAGLAQCDGLLKDTGDALVLEIQMQDALMGVLKSAVREIRIPIDDVVSLTLTKGWLGTDWLGVTLVLQTSKVALLSEFPGASQGRVELSIARKDVADAERFLANFHDPPAD